MINCYSEDVVKLLEKYDVVELVVVFLNDLIKDDVS